MSNDPKETSKEIEEEKYKRRLTGTVYSNTVTDSQRLNTFRSEHKYMLNGWENQLLLRVIAKLRKDEE